MPVKESAPNFGPSLGADSVADLSSRRYALTLTDLETGSWRLYVNPAGSLGSLGNSASPLPSSGSALASRQP